MRNKRLDEYAMYRYGKYFKDLPKVTKIYVKKRIKILNKYIK